MLSLNYFSNFETKSAMTTSRLPHVCGSFEAHVVGDGRERRDRAGPQHLAPGYGLHVPHGHLVVLADGRDKRGRLGWVGWALSRYM